MDRILNNLLEPAAARTRNFQSAKLTWLRSTVPEIKVVKVILADFGVFLFKMTAALELIMYHSIVFARSDTFKTTVLHFVYFLFCFVKTKCNWHNHKQTKWPFCSHCSTCFTKTSWVKIYTSQWYLLISSTMSNAEKRELKCKLMTFTPAVFEGAGITQHALKQVCFLTQLQEFPDFTIWINILRALAAGAWHSC